MKKLIKSYAFYFKNRDFLYSFLISFVMLAVALFINFYAGLYATDHASNSVTDIILSNISTYDVDGIFIYGAFAFWIFFICLCSLYPHKIPFTAKTLSLFIVIRSIFISLTHLGPFPSQIVISATSIISKFSFGADLFFSGHTGIPFLFALIFWDTPRLRWAFIATSIMFGIVVLLGHLHYSIDVLSAFFITYTIFHLAELFFKKDRIIFHSGIPPASILETK